MIQKYINHFVLGVSGFLVFFSILNPGILLAAEGPVEVVDATTLVYDNRTFVDTNPYDTTYEWVNEQGCAKDKLHVNNYRGSNMSFSAEIHSGGSCGKEDIENIPVTNGSRIDIQGYKIDDNNILMPTGFRLSGCDSISLGKTSSWLTGNQSMGFQRTSEDDPNYNENLFFGNLTQIRLTQSGDKANVKIEMECTTGPVTVSQKKEFNNLKITSELTSRVAEVYSNVLTEEPDGSFTYLPTGGDTKEEDDSQGRNANCMTNANGFGLAWVMCPVYNIAESAMNKILNYMRDIMYTNIGEDSKELKLAWGGLKNVANGVLVIALLVILIGQALKGSW